MIHPSPTHHPDSPFALGTVNWGTKLTGDPLDALYDTYRAAGGHIFDSAHVYAFWLPNGYGASERALGELVRRRGDRDRVTLATKGGHPAMDGYPRDDRYLSPEALAADIGDSLDRLGTDRIDLYFLHRDDSRVPVGEIVDALHEHATAGRLRSLGVSNWGTARIEAANAYAAAHGRTPFVASQPKFSLAVATPSKDPTVPTFADADIAWHARTGLAVYAYSPTANGYFATGGKRAAGGWASPVSTARLHAAEGIARDTGASANQIALAWLLHQPFPVTPILGTGDIAHLRDALAAGEIKLSREQMRALTDAE